MSKTWGISIVFGIASQPMTMILIKREAHLTSQNPMYTYNIYLLAPAIIPIYKATCQGTLRFVRSHALDKSLYKSVEISSFQKINIIGGFFVL
ncbi:MAG: hypothetical protein LBM19_03840 [Holosporales bacterium]|nr:hypothetical protein [Holosporales bacterium]